MLQHDVSTPRPYSRIHLISGTKAFAQKYPLPGKIAVGHEDFLTEDQLKDLENKYTPEIVNRIGQLAKRIGGHGGMDFMMDWRLIDCLSAWEGNWTSDCFVACTWQHTEDRRLLIAVNYAANQSQCYIRLPFGDLAGRSVRLIDLMGSACYERAGNELLTRGLYLDVAPWAYHAFEVTAYS